MGLLNAIILNIEFEWWGIEGHRDSKLKDTTVIYLKGAAKESIKSPHITIKNKE